MVHNFEFEDADFEYFHYLSSIVEPPTTLSTWSNFEEIDMGR